MKMRFGISPKKGGKLKTEKPRRSGEKDGMHLSHSVFLFYKIIGERKVADMANTRTTPAEVIGRVDGIRPNAFDEHVKTGWINKVDGMVQTEVLKLDEAEMKVYSYPQDADEQLSVPHPYTDIYDFYLMAMIDFANNETELYANDMTMFNNAFAEFKNSWQQKNYGADGLFVRNIW